MSYEIRVEYDEYLNETFFYATHKSGLKVIFVPKKLTSFYVILGVGYGSVDSSFKTADEDEYKRVPDGIAHYLEHKMFECPDGSDAFASFSKFGANANAFTTHNLTAYLFSCTSNFKESLVQLLKFVSEPYFTQENVDKERPIISEEIEMYEDDPYSALHYGMLELLYKNNPVKINVAGTVKSVSEITPEHLYRCYNAFYTPENMVLSVSGDTDIETILSACDEILDEKREGFRTDRKPCFEDDFEVECEKNTIYRPVSLPLFCIGIKDKVEATSEQRIKRSVAGSVLIDMLFGSSSAFFSDLYDDGTVNSMSCGYDSMINYAFSYVIGESVDPERAYAEFHRVIRSAAEGGINYSDFLRLKKVALSNFVKGFDSTENIATEALYMSFEGIDMDKYASVIRDIDFEYVKGLAREMFSQNNCCIMTVLPADRKG